MREVWPRFNEQVFLNTGFPYPGELAYGYRNEFIDIHLLSKVVDNLNRNEVPLVLEEQEMVMLLSDETERMQDLALQLSKYEHENSNQVWQFYFTVAIADTVADPVKKFELLDSVWADLGYPDSMISIIYPEDGHPAHIYLTLGEKTLSNFIIKWRNTLTHRDPAKRVRLGEVPESMS
jgi:hypothetical protein